MIAKMSANAYNVNRLNPIRPNFADMYYRRMPNSDFEHFESVLDSEVARLKAGGASKVTDRAISLALGRSHDFLSLVRRRKSVPKRDGLIDLGEHFNIDWQLFLPPEQRSRASTSTINIPIYDVQAAGGDGVVIEDQERVGHIGFERSWLRRLTSASASNLMMIQLEGRSMEPTIEDGAWVLVDRTSKKPASNSVYAFRIGDDALIKRLIIDPIRERATLKSDNPTWADIQDVPLGDLSILGRVIWKSSKL